MAVQCAAFIAAVLATVATAGNLIIEQELDDQVNVKSLEELKLVCKIRGVTDGFTWLYDDQPISLDSETIEIKHMPTKSSSRLTINPATTVDGGKYTCCGKSAEDSACTSSHVTVAFDSMPDSSDGEFFPPTEEITCFSYPDSGEGICRDYLKGSEVHAETAEGIPEIEKQIKTAITHLRQRNMLSDRCGEYAPRAFCHYLLPTCVNKNHIRLCRADCEMLKHSFCDAEFQNFSSIASGQATSGIDMIMSGIASRFDCRKLPTVDDQCTAIGLPPVLNTSHTCYEGTGLGYRGGRDESATGKECVKWEDVPDETNVAEYQKYAPKNFVELSGGHRYCRNPINQKKYPEALMDTPWCFVRQLNGDIKPEACQIEKCPSNNILTQEALMILLPSLAVSLVLGILAISYWLCKRRKPKDTKGQAMANTPDGRNIEGAFQPNYQETANPASSFRPSSKLRLPELPANSVVLKKEIGEAYYGTVYLAEIVPNLLYAPQHPVAAKSLAAESNTQQIHQFWREIEMLSELRHDRIVNLRAVVMQPQLRAMLFEYTDLGDLKNFLLTRSPHSDMSTGAQLALDQQIDICHQICQGMEYLSSGERPYVHRDLAARNILIDSRMNIKISNIGIARAETTSDYFNPQLATDAQSEPAQTLIPVRWMSPESLLEANYTTASDTWSYAVCCWEVFSFGTQPFCGYSNEEVMELVIHRKQVLPCPETCPLQIYNLLINCWSYQAASRPNFIKIGMVLDQLKRGYTHGPRKQYSSASTALTSSVKQAHHRNTNQHNNDIRSHISRTTTSSTENSVVHGGNSVPGSPPPYESSWKSSSIRDQHAPPASPVRKAI